jgi:hypothetical protein
MTTPLLTTKLYIPPVRPELVSRPRLIERFNAGLDRKLTLISAPAGYGKTMLLSEWIARRIEMTPPLPVAWLSLDEGDNDPARFLVYLIAALQTIEANIGEGALGVLQSRQPPPTEPILTALINDGVAMEKASEAIEVTQGEMPVKRPMETFSRAAISVKSALMGVQPKKAPGATANSSTRTCSAPRCDSSSFAIMAARSRSWELPGKPGPTSVQIALTTSKAYCAS